MAQYYFGKRTRNIFDPKSEKPFRLSRSKIELFIKCPRCFYLDRRLGVGQPPGFPFNLNSAVDALLKKEFDIHRSKKSQHPLMKAYGLKAVPYSHPDIDIWRENFKGLEYHHPESNFLVTGAIDDVWIDEEGNLLVVDYKATSKDGEVGLDAEWQRSYKNQMEIYQWLLRQNGFNVSDVGYFVYANGRKDAEAFDGKLEFDVKLIPYTGDDSWVAEKLIEAKQCLDSVTIPNPSPSCDFCLYRKEASKALGQQ